MPAFAWGELHSCQREFQLQRPQPRGWGGCLLCSKERTEVLPLPLFLGLDRKEVSLERAPELVKFPFLLLSAPPPCQAVSGATD